MSMNSNKYSIHEFYFRFDMWKEIEYGIRNGLNNFTKINQPKDEYEHVAVCVAGDTNKLSRLCNTVRECGKERMWTDIKVVSFRF